MHPCAFCQILAEQAEASMVYEDEVCAAFMDIYPANPGHILVISREHAPDLASLDEVTGGRLFVVGMRLATALRRSGLPFEGINFFLADGAAAGQEIFHVHLHVFPRVSGDGYSLEFAPKYQKSPPTRAELDSAAERIRKEPETGGP